MSDERANSTFKVLITQIRSKSIDEYLQKNAHKIYSQKIFNLFSSCYRYTLETKIFYSLYKEDDAFVYCTNLPVMWPSQACIQIYP